jgi:hypothetical protein
VTSEAPRAYGFFAKLINLVVVFLIHIVVAPVVAAFAFMTLLLMWISYAPTAQPPEIVTVGLLLAFMISFAVALAPAAAMGAGFALWQTFVGRVRWPVAASAGLMSGFGAAAMFDAYERAPGEKSLLPIFLLTGLAATLTSCALSRSFVTAHRPSQF